MKIRTRYQSKPSFIAKYERAFSLAVAGLSLLALSGQAASPLYQSVVIGDGPLGYYRFNDSTNRPNINVNSGSLGSTGNATNLNTHAVNETPVRGTHHASTYFDSTARTIVPWTAALNPNASNDFTIEGWFNPASDGTFGTYAGPSPIMNRFSGAAINRQGWVFFQRSPDTSYSNPDGVGWNFRTYTGVGSDVGVTLTSQVPYRLGEWQYVVVVWSGAAQTATMYINGTNAGSAGNSSGDPLAYVANTQPTNGETDAPNGPAGFSMGSYNNTDPGSDPYQGGEANVAFYSKQLTPAQILAHYQNATNTSRAESYDALVQSDGSVGYWPLNDLSPATSDVAVNQGTLKASGEAVNTAEVRHPGSAPLAVGNSSSFVYHFRDGNSTTDLPWTAANNPPASVPFTLELWVRPTWDQISTGEAPINNRYVSSGNRTGWVIFQRNPNASYNGQSGSSGIGWTFRMYDGTGSSGQDATTSVPYNVGDWQHLVFTWQPQTDLGPGANNTDVWEGIETAYVDGVSVQTNSSAEYCGNTSPTEDATAPADFAIGSYNAASGLGNNPFEGEVADVAFYNNYVLTTNQILDHYETGTNAHPATNYATLVLTAAYDGAGTQGLQPATFFRLNEPAFLPAKNSGTLGDAALGSLVDTTNDVAGPITSGFEVGNLAVPVGNPNGWASLGNPPGLTFSNQLTLEAWILPDATQVDGTNCIISFGPPTLSDYTGVTNTGIELSSNEISLCITNSGADYAFNFYDGTNYHGVSYPVGNDLTSNQWVYLAGTFDGTTWRLFRNGVDVTNSTDAVSSLPVPGSEWGIGATGQGWASYFNGSIDEVAIYNKALSPATINAHYFVAQSGAVSLTITRSGGNVTLTWAAGTLQQSSSLTGPWTDVSAATSPYQAPIGSTSGGTFYRVTL
jgi:hypothetical protein